MLQPLPFHEPDRLVLIWEDAHEIGFPKNTPAAGNYFSWKERNRTFRDIAATSGAAANLTVDGPPEFVFGRRVTSNFFEVLGVRPIVGRTFTEDEDRTGERVTIISYGLWQRRYGGDPNVVGKPIVMNGERRTIVGVMPRTFVFRDRERAFWNPIQFTSEQRASRSSHGLNVVGRLAPGVSVEAARRDIRVITDQLRREFPGTNAKVGSVVEPLRNDLLGDRRDQLIVLIAALVCVLLVACANVAGLLLLRAFNRRGELAVRASLGATRGRLVRQLIAEAVMLACAGGALGLILAPAGARVLAEMVPIGLFPLEVRVFDPRLMAVTLLIAFVTALVFSLGPAFHASRASLTENLQKAGRSRMSSSRWSREALVVSQIAVAVVLLVGTGLLLRTFANLRGTEIGFRPEGLLTIRTSLAVARYSKHADRVAFFDRVIAGVASLPGVQSAAYVSIPPFGSIGNTAGFLIEGWSATERQDALVRVGTVDYLQTIGAELCRWPPARPPGSGNRTSSGCHQRDVCQIALAESPRRRAPHLARRTGSDANDCWSRPRYQGAGYDPEAKPAAYLANPQVGGTNFMPETLVVRASGDLSSLIAPIRGVIANVDPEQPISAIRTMEEMLDRDVVDRKQQATLLAIFTSIAVLLSTLGLYAVLAYGVAQRKQEIAVRMAVGASGGSVMRGIALGGQKLLLLGLGCRIGWAWATSRMMETLLVGVTPSDPVTFGAAGTLLWVVAVLACGIPALRAARVSPATLLRGD